MTITVPPGAQVRSMPVAELAARFRPWSEGEETWQQRYVRLWTDEVDKMIGIHAAMRAHGWVGTPAVLGWNGKVWDGTHRIVVGLQLALAVPVPCVLLRAELPIDVVPGGER